MDLLGSGHTSLASLGGMGELAGLPDSHTTLHHRHQIATSIARTVRGLTTDLPGVRKLSVRMFLTGPTVTSCTTRTSRCPRTARSPRLSSRPTTPPTPAPWTPPSPPAPPPTSPPPPSRSNPVSLKSHRPDIVFLRITERLPNCKTCSGGPLVMDDWSIKVFISVRAKYYLSKTVG